MRLASIKCLSRNVTGWVEMKNSAEEAKLDLAFNNVKPKDWYFVLD